MIRLLDTETGQFVEVRNHEEHEYAILLHVWDWRGEQSYQDVRHVQESFILKMITAFVYMWSIVVRYFLLLLYLVSHTPHRISHVIQAILHPLQPDVPLRALRGADPFLAQSPDSGWLRKIAERTSSWTWLECSIGISSKIRRACAVARAHGYRYLWIDSCCIDKTSSAELSEAINSMYTWYRGASLCYAFLADVPDMHNLCAVQYHFRDSKWFTRGWTLQELIAPRTLVFLSLNWNVIGTKSTVADVIEEITGIDATILTHDKQLDEVSVAKRMSWASRRMTTRVEDEAYSLMGIFNVRIPTLYGEGRRAFIRLQEEILKEIPDQSLFAWGQPIPDPLPSPLPSAHPYEFRAAVFTGTPLFADCPERFLATRNIRRVSHEAFASRLGIPNLMFPGHSISPYGVRMHLPLIPIRHLLRGDAGGHSSSEGYFAILACESSTREGHLIALVCSENQDRSRHDLSILTVGSLQWGPRGMPELFQPCHLVTLSPDDVASCQPFIVEKTVYLVPYNPPASSRLHDNGLVHGPNGDVPLFSWCLALLERNGFEASCTASADAPQRRRLVIRKGDARVVGEYESTVIGGRITICLVLRTFRDVPGVPPQLCATQWLWVHSGAPMPSVFMVESRVAGATGTDGGRIPMEFAIRDVPGTSAGGSRSFLEVIVRPEVPVERTTGGLVGRIRGRAQDARTARGVRPRRR